MGHSDKIWLAERKKRIASLLSEIEPDIKGEKILDIGMGKWSLIKHLFPDFYVIGVDQKQPDIAPDEFYLRDITAGLPFKDGVFSLVFEGEVLEHLGLQHARQLLKESRRVLRGGGYLLLTTPNGFRTMPKRILRRPIVEAHSREFTFLELNRYLAETGFSVISTEGIQPLFVPWRFTDILASLKLHGLISSQLILLCKK